MGSLRLPLKFEDEKHHEEQKCLVEDWDVLGKHVAVSRTDAMYVYYGLQ
jgi:hypothetical protein